MVDAINEGDSYEPNNPSRVTITDVYLTPGDGSDVRVLVRAELRGEATDDLPAYANAPPRL